MVLLVWIPSTTHYIAHDGVMLQLTARCQCIVINLLNQVYDIEMLSQSLQTKCGYNVGVR